MLKLTDDGAKVTLQSQPQALDSGLFWFGAALLVGAVVVALAMSLLPVRWSIGALALLIIGSFFFNRQRQQHKKAMSGVISSGILWVRDGELVHDNQGKREHIHLSEDDKITLENEQLQIITTDDVRKYHISGFDSMQEAQATKAILEGQALNKRHVNIKMNSD
jgi:membrane protein implicated in regulation of membrane protease activity